MLKNLSIQNFALIDSLNIDFSENLNIITGETGAGKSIILGALHLILGERADSKSLNNKSEKCIVEGSFDVSKYSLQSFFEENDLDYADVCILRREINPEGKSRAFVNDTPCNVSVLKQLSEKLIDIHSQHETLEINRPGFQLNFVDLFCGHGKEVAEFTERYKGLRSKETELERMISESEHAKKDLDYFQFQFDELEEARLQEGEQADLEKELEILTHAEEIKRNLINTLELINTGEESLLQKTKESIQSLHTIEKFDPEIEKLNERIRSIQIELKDIAVELEALEGNTGMDLGRLQLVTDRLELIYKLEQKHRVGSVGELIDLKKEIEQKLNSALNIDTDIEKLMANIDIERKDLLKIAKGISEKRNSMSKKIEEQITNNLKSLSLDNARFKIENVLLKDGEMNATGMDQIKFYFSANLGMELRELNKVASGGELSRLMLSIKSLIGKKASLSTMIFDEIDTGISGEVALKVGAMMENISADLQVISITHLPQIASKGNSHYFVYKESEKGVTKTGIKKLNQEERVVEIAKMLSGNTPSESAIANAKELIHSN